MFDKRARQVRGYAVGVSVWVGTLVGVRVSAGAAVSVGAVVGRGVGVGSAASSSLKNWKRNRMMSNTARRGLMARFMEWILSDR